MPRKSPEEYREYQRKLMKQRRERAKADTLAKSGGFATSPALEINHNAEAIPAKVSTNDGVLPPTPAQNSPLKSTPAPATNKLCLVVTLKQTQDKEKDIKLLHELLKVLDRHPGDIPFYLKIDQPDKVTTLWFPQIKVKVDLDLDYDLACLLAGPCYEFLPGELSGKEKVKC